MADTFRPRQGLNSFYFVLTRREHHCQMTGHHTTRGDNMRRPEEGEQRAVASCLAAIPGVVWFHPGAERASKVARLVQAALGAQSGIPDVIVIRPLLAAAEIKPPRGPRGGRRGRPTPKQVWWLEQLAIAGFAIPRLPGNEPGVCYGATELLDWLIPLIDWTRSARQ